VIPQKAVSSAAVLTGFQLMIKQEQDAIDRRNKELTKMGIGSPDVLNAADTAISSKTTLQIQAQGKQWAEQIDNMVAQVQQSSLQGFFAIDVKIGAQQAKLVEDFTKQWGNFDPYPTPHNQQELAREGEWFAAGKKLEQGLTAIAKDGDDERARLMRQNDDAVADAAADAARSTLPPWLQANQEISDNFNKTTRGIVEQFNDTKLTKPQAKALYASAIEETNAELVNNFRQMRDEIAGQLESVFDDLTSGNIGQAILGEFKHLFSEILAQWILTLNGIKGASAGNGGFLNSLFGGSPFSFLFGGGGGASGASSLLSLGAAAPLALGAYAPTSLTSGLNNPFSASAGGGIVGLTNPFVSVAGLSSGAGTASIVASQAQSQAANTLIGSTLEQSLAKVFPHGLSIGGLKISGAATAGLGAGVGLESILSAYSLGSPGLGVAGGAGGGALLGFSVGGPLGAGVGAAIGGIVGLLSGLFGGQARKNGALALISGTLSPAIDQIVTDYDSFNTQQQDAIGQLNDLEQQAKQQLDQLGQDKLYWANFVPLVNKAEDEINQTQSIRDSRAALNFAPPQFSGGGTIPGVGPVLMIGHGGEEVVRQPYASMYRQEIKAINSGADLRVPVQSGQHLSINMPVTVYAQDSGDVKKFFDKHSDAMRASLRANMLRNFNGGNL
jgi:hypothetical protein